MGERSLILGSQWSMVNRHNLAGLKNSNLRGVCSFIREDTLRRGLKPPKPLKKKFFSSKENIKKIITTKV